MIRWNGEGDFAQWLLKESEESLRQERLSPEETPKCKSQLVSTVDSKGRWLILVFPKNPLETQVQNLQTLLETRNDHRQRELRRSNRSKNSGEPPIRTLLAYGNKHFSTRSLKDLERIELSNMKWHKIHHGRYLLVRIISHPTRTTSICFIGQDPSGQAEVIELQTTVDMLVRTGPELDTLYPIGMLLAIREPYYTHGLDGDASDDTGTKKVPRIRVESPSDVICVGANDRRVSGLTWATPLGSPTIELNTQILPSEEAKLVGNERLKKGWFMSAERAYTQGLTADSSHTVLRLNRAHCRIKLSRFRGALIDGEHALRSLLGVTSAENLESTESIHLNWLQKAYHRVVLALIGLRDWPVAYEHCTAFVDRFPSFTPARDLLAFTKARMIEARTGIYDWASIYRGDQQPGGTTNVVADWVSPSFKIGYSPTSNGVRGVVADRMIKPGELLVVCKPFAAVDPKELKEEANTVVANLPTKQLESVSQAYLTRAMIAKVEDEPKVWNVLKKLYAGPGYPDPGLADVDAFKLPGALGDIGEADEPQNVDVSRLEGIRTYNSFAVKSVTIKEMGPSATSSPSEETSSGIYLVPSLFNHACFANVSWNFWGDLMILRSRQAISPGEELTISYYADHSFDDRTQSLLKYGIDQCSCILCNDERLDTPAQRALRADALADLFACRDGLSEARMTNEGGLCRQPRGTTAKFMKLVRSIESTYALTRSKSLMFELFAPFSILSDVHVNEVMGGMKDPRETSLLINLATEWERRALESCGFSGIEPDGKGTLLSGPFAHEMVCVSAGLSIISLLDGLGREKDAHRWARVVLKMNQIIFGGEKETLVVLWKGLLDSMNLIPFFK